MPTLETVDPRLMYIMMKGEPGTRKSSQALSFPGKQYWFSWDRKMQGLLLPMRAFGIDPKMIEYDDFDSWSSGKINPLKKLEDLRINCPYDVLVFDSITSCADMTLRQTVSVKAGSTTRSGNQAGKQVAGISVNEIEDYNAESSALQELIALTKDIQSYQYSKGHIVTIILIAHVVQAEYRNNTTNTTHVSRTIVTAGKKVAPKIPAYCSEVWHFNIKKGFVADAPGEYSMLTQHTGDDFARTALPLAKEIVFGDKPLYSTWIEPAIKEIQSNPLLQAKTI